jgi:hypothetical protein
MDGCWHGKALASNLTLSRSPKSTLSHPCEARTIHVHVLQLKGETQALRLWVVMHVENPQRSKLPDLAQHSLRYYDVDSNRLKL